MAKPDRKEPTWKFRGYLVIPAYLAYLLCDKTINGADLILLLVIEGDARDNDDWCSASNKELAEGTAFHHITVSKMIRKLVRLDLLVEVVIDGTRYLEPKWFRTAEEWENPRGRYAEMLRKARESSR